MSESEIQSLTKSEKSFYARQLILNDGKFLNEQIRLKNSRVWVIGAGGLGSSCLMYLAGLGIGHIEIFDQDEVAVHNLHRQVIHSCSAIGINKAVSAANRIKEINPHCEVVAHSKWFASEFVRRCSQDDVDVIVDCSDNPNTRVLINDAGLFLDKPVVSASALKFQGQLTVYNFTSYVKTFLAEQDEAFPPEKRIRLLSEIDTGFPCWRCLNKDELIINSVISSGRNYPCGNYSPFSGANDTPMIILDGLLSAINNLDSASNTCEAHGVFSPLPGLLGVYQAIEVAKICMHADPDTIMGGKMLLVDMFSVSQRTINLRPRRMDCLCRFLETSRGAVMTRRFDYVRSCSSSSRQVPEEICRGSAVCCAVKDSVLSLSSEDIMRMGFVYARGSLGGQMSVRCNKDSVIIVDVRSAAHYSVQRIEDSISYPFEKFISELKSLILLCCEDHSEKRASDLRRRVDAFYSSITTGKKCDEESDMESLIISRLSPVVCVCRRGIDSLSVARSLAYLQRIVSYYLPKPMDIQLYNFTPGLNNWKINGESVFSDI